MSRSFGPCMCGACDCPSCGPAQGYTVEWKWVGNRKVYFNPEEEDEMEDEEEFVERSPEEKDADVAAVWRALLLHGLPVSREAARTAWERACAKGVWVAPPTDTQLLYQVARRHLEGLAAQMYRVRTFEGPKRKSVGVVLAMSRVNAIRQFFPKQVPFGTTADLV